MIKKIINVEDISIPVIITMIPKKEKQNLNINKNCIRIILSDENKIWQAKIMDSKFYLVPILSNYCARIGNIYLSKTKYDLICYTIIECLVETRRDIIYCPTCKRWSFEAKNRNCSIKNECLVGRVF